MSMLRQNADRADWRTGKGDGANGAGEASCSWRKPSASNVEDKSRSRQNAWRLRRARR
jgi:hypothetical protein